MKISLSIRAIPQRFILRNPNIDTSTIRVTVRETLDNTNVTEYQLASNIIGYDGSSNIFFIQEGEDERYEIIFGDGVLGNKLTTNNFIEVSYITTNGSDANAARVFTYSAVLEDAVGNINYAPTITLTTVSSCWRRRRT